MGGCSDSSEPGSEPGSPSSTSTTRQIATDAEVVDAYLAGWEAFYAAANPPDPDHPDLPKYLTGPYLRTVRANLTDLRDRGTAIRRGEQSTPFDPRVVEVTATAALLEDCWVDADVQFDVATQEIVDDDVVVVSARFRMVEEDGLWKADDNTFETAGPFDPDDIDRLPASDSPCEPNSDVG